MKSIEVIVRAVIIKDGKVLLCKAFNGGTYFLPGGHVEFGESAETSIIREMQEEAAAVVKNLKYVGLFENKYGSDEDPHHEVNILYTAELENNTVVSQESHIAFEWISFEEFRNVKFLPTFFADELNNYFSNPKQIYLPLI